MMQHPQELQELPATDGGPSVQAEAVEAHQELACPEGGEALDADEVGDLRIVLTRFAGHQVFTTRGRQGGRRAALASALRDLADELAPGRRAPHPSCTCIGRLAFSGPTHEAACVRFTPASSKGGRR